MTPDEMYDRLSFVHQIVDAFSVVVPWGGLAARCTQREGAVDIANIAAVVRSLVLNGEAHSLVRIGELEKEVALVHRDYDPEHADRGHSPLVAMGGNADFMIDQVSNPAAQDFLEVLKQDFEVTLGLPAWVLQPGAETKSQKLALNHFRMRCERYRRDIDSAVTRAFRGEGCRINWRTPLEGDGLAKFAPIYRALREGLGINLAGLLSEAANVTQQAVDVGLFSRQERLRVLAQYGPE